MAARLWRDRQARGQAQDTDTEPTPKAKRPTYRQSDWPAYHAAQVNERGHFMELLADLCRGIPEPPRKPAAAAKSTSTNWHSAPPRDRRNRQRCVGRRPLARKQSMAMSLNKPGVDCACGELRL